MHYIADFDVSQYPRRDECVRNAGQPTRQRYMDITGPGVPIVDLEAFIVRMEVTRISDLVTAVPMALLSAKEQGDAGRQILDAQPYSDYKEI
jgi:hypothetical protein